MYEGFEMILAAIIAPFIAMFMLWVMFVGISMICHTLDILDKRYENKSRKSKRD